MNQSFEEAVASRVSEPCVVACSALSKIITTGYKALSLMYFFTVGPDEVKAWTIQVSDRAQFACFVGDKLNLKWFCQQHCHKSCS